MTIGYSTSGTGQLRAEYEGSSLPAHFAGVSKTPYALATSRCFDYWYDVQRTGTSSRGMIRPSQLWAAGGARLGSVRHRLLGRTEVGGSPFHRLAADRDRRPRQGTRFVGTDSVRQSGSLSQCMRSHGVPNFPDPVLTPSGGYGYRTTGIDPNSSGFQGALKACKAPTSLTVAVRPAGSCLPHNNRRG